MAYHLGIDLGTTYTAAATWRGDRPYVVNLGSRTPTIPSVVLLREDGELLTGEAAERRAVIEPQRVAREFKRRMGDPTPVILGGAPYSAPALTARLLRAVVDSVMRLEGSPPTAVVVAHPANWGDYKQDLLYQAIHLAELDGVTTVTEPEAAAIHYAAQERVAVDANVAVYDLGGGTFDAAVLRRTESAWECRGEPEGIEQLGGIDFDEAIFQHVKTTIGADALDRLDPDDPPTRVGVARLRQECVQAKEALTFDTVVSIPVLLPTVQMEVRLTRAEFENMIEPSLADSIAATKRAIRSAGIAAEEVGTVLLVGGSSRIPLVAQLVEAEVGRPIAVDAHPKHVVALGSAITAADRAFATAAPEMMAGASVALVSRPPVGAGVPVNGVPAPSSAASPPSGPDPVQPELSGDDGSLLPLLSLPSSAVAMPDPLPGAAGLSTSAPYGMPDGADAPIPPPSSMVPSTPTSSATRVSYDESGDDGDHVVDDYGDRRPVGFLLGSLVALAFIAATAWIVLRSDHGGAQRVDGSPPSTAAISGSEPTGDDDESDDDEETTTSSSLPPDSSTTLPGVTTPTVASKDERAPTTTVATSPPTTEPSTTTTESTTTTSTTTTTTEPTTSSTTPG